MGVLVKIEANRSRVANDKASGAWAVKLPTDWGLVREIGIRAQDF